MKQGKQSVNKGLVVSHLGKALAVESAPGKIILCHTRRRLDYPAVGDWVLWETCGDDQGRVVEILPRKTVLIRPGVNGRTRPVAANIDQLFIVLAIQPDCDFLLIDQLLVVCENREIAAHLVLNKMDLVDKQKHENLMGILSNYQRLGYPLFQVSVKTKQGIDQIRDALRNHASMFSGQSGVGKSSISAALLGDINVRTAALSAGTGRGKHTTTKSSLYHLSGGGDLIDSPGIAIFGLAEMTQRDLASGYREFRPFIEHCSFNDCRHINDKGCAVRAEVEAGKIESDRYQRYQKLLEKLLKPED